jgi:hypothetical protein
MKGRKMLVMAEIALQILSIGSGFYAAFLWWQSSNTTQVVHSMPSAGSGVGDLLIQLDGGEYIVYNNGKQASLNKAAAAWTAASVGFQAATVAARFFQ